MLRNSRNVSKSKYLRYGGCSWHNTKQSIRTVTHGLRQYEEGKWRSELDQVPRTWADAEPGEVWDLKLDGEWDLYVKLESGHWKSLEHKWYIIQGDGDEEITSGNLTEVEVDVLEY